jgi:hypothetical protein
MHRRINPAAAVAVLTVTLAAVASPTAVGAASAERSTPSARAVSRSSPVRFCPADSRHIDGNGTPSRKVHVPPTVSRPVGLRIPDSMALYGVANDRPLATGGNGSLAYQTLAGPTAFACSGVGVSQDDVSWASFRSRTVPSHSITATFLQGQDGFPALCEYLVAAQRPAAARAWAHTFAAKARQCRGWTNDTPGSARLRQVTVTATRSGPTVIVIHAPRGAELTGPALTKRGKFVSGPRTTTPTVSVAIFSFKSTKSFTWPQTLDCSVPAPRPHTCAAAAAAFVDEALQGSYQWAPRGAARAARKVASTIG